MRFVFGITLAIYLNSPANAAPWDIVSIGDETTPAIRPIQMQRGGSSETLQTIKGLTLSIAMKNLGNISAMAIGDNGTLYVADRKSGRIWALPDRGMDGKIDQRRPLPMRFDSPNGLAVIDKTLYVADRQAIWKLTSGQDATQLASLANAKSTGELHPLTAAQDEPSLLLGLTKMDGESQVIKINIETGRAENIGGSFGNVIALSKRSGAAPWVSSNHQLYALSSPQNAITFNSNQLISAFILPGQFETPAQWPSQLKDHIIGAQIGPEAMRLIAIPTEFGQANGDIRVLVDGFHSATQRSAWGAPGPIVMDKRGLFFADTHNGTVWKLSPSPKKIDPEKGEVIITAKTEPELTPEIKSDKAPLLSGSSITGSQMDAANQLNTASQLKVGSTLIEAYDKKKAEEEKVKAEQEKSKKTFRQR